jgi:hypothetical protein
MAQESAQGERHQPEEQQARGVETGGRECRDAAAFGRGAAVIRDP